jgi:four helix bundle protein
MGRRKADVEELKERMKRFGPTVIHLAEKMPGSRAATVVSNQMVRAGTSAGANYRSACRARSRADFIAKMGIVEEELDETLCWLEVSIEAGFLAFPDLASFSIRTKDLVRRNSAFRI